MGRGQGQGHCEFELTSNKDAKFISFHLSYLNSNCLSILEIHKTIFFFFLNREIMVVLFLCFLFRIFHFLKIFLLKQLAFLERQFIFRTYFFHALVIKFFSTVDLDS